MLAGKVSLIRGYKDEYGISERKKNLGGDFRFGHEARGD
jgi:hypothetical protein